MIYNTLIMIQLETITEEKEGLTTLLAKLYPDVSKNKLKNFYTSKRVMRGGFLTIKDTPLKIGEKITILKKPQFLGDLLIYYVDKDIIVLEKPAYLLSVDADNSPGNSVHASLKRRYGSVFPVQRLDRETTGVMVFALSREAKEGLKKQFEEKLVEREYVAIAEGLLKEDKGTWKSFLQEGGDKKMRVAGHGVLAITHFETKKRLKKGATFIRCKLETGKKNQIRVHAAHAGHPLLGDSRYGHGKKGKTLFLHANKLAFFHPIREKKMHFTSPIPKEFHTQVF
ncbi:RluA family pseudouridine synthase [bacterium]|nr:RluA family pseudouridine synthase [bacterium]